MKSKYPQYAGIADAELAQKVIAKHPEYQSRITQAAPETPQSTMGMAKQAIGETLKEPVPYLGAAVEGLRNKIPGAIAEETGNFSEALRQAGYGKSASAVNAFGVGLAGTIGTVGELLPKTGGELALTGLAGPAVKGAMAGIKKVAPQVISGLSRNPLPVVERAIERTDEISNPALKLPETAENAVAALGDKLKEGRRLLGQKLARIEDAVAGKNMARSIPVKDIGVKLSDDLSNAGFAVPGRAVGDVTRKLNPAISEIITDLENIKSISLGKGAVPKGSAGLNFKDALTLRRKIDSIVEWDRARALGLDSAEEAILKNARHALNEKIKAVDPTFRKANDAFKRMAEQYKSLEKTVFGGSQDAIQNRIVRMFRKGDADRKIAEKVDRITSTGGKQLDTILDAETARAFAPVINPGATRAAGNTGGGLMVPVAAALGTKMFGLGATGGAGAAALALTSPRANLAAIRAAKAIAPTLRRPGLPAGLTALEQARRRRNGPKNRD